jgi:HK97 family phage prohead protease
MRKLIDQQAFHQAARHGRAAGAGVTRQAVVLRAPDDGSRVVRFVLSDGSVDRMGDTIDPAGWDLTAYKRNPVVLFGHDASKPPIGRMRSVWSDGARLLGDVEFAPPEVYDFADTIYRLTTAGYLHAGSVGFLPTEYSFVENDPDRGYGIDFKRQELLEFSICPVPANSNALVDAKAKGIVSAGHFRRLRSAPTTGNCGRPAGSECGLKNPADCAVHAAADLDDDTGVDGGDSEKAVRLRKIAALQRQLSARATITGEPEPELTRAGVAARVRAIRPELTKRPSWYA